MCLEASVIMHWHCLLLMKSPVQQQQQWMTMTSHSLNTDVYQLELTIAPVFASLGPQNTFITAHSHMWLANVCELSHKRMYQIRTKVQSFLALNVLSNIKNRLF